MAAASRLLASSLVSTSAVGAGVLISSVFTTTTFLSESHCPPSSAFLAVANSSLSKGFFSRTENAPAQESRLELLSKGGEEAEERPVDCASKVFALNVASTSMSMESLS